MSGRPGWVFYISVLLLGGFVALGIWRPAELAAGSEQALEFTTSHFGWLYLFVTTGFLLFCLGVGLSDYGRIPLGGGRASTEFCSPTWLAMISSAGMGVGLVFWRVAESMNHYVNPPLGMADARSAEAAELGLLYSLFHWGFDKR